MQQSYEDNGLNTIILTTGKELLLTDDELKELVKDNKENKEYCDKLNSTISNLKNQNKDLENKLQSEFNNSLIIKNELTNYELENSSLKEQLRLLKNGNQTNPEGYLDADDAGFKMSEEDILLIQKHPELKYSIEKLQDGKLSHKTIYGLLRIFSFRMNYLVEKLSMDKCIRKANMYAIKYTKDSFIAQYIKLEKEDFIYKDEIQRMVEISDKLEKPMTKPDGDNNRKYYYIFMTDEEVGVATDMWENGPTENEKFNSGLISTIKDEVIQRAKDYAEHYKIQYLGLFGVE